MIYFQFVVALSILLYASKVFTDAAEKLGKYYKLSSFVIGIFIVGIGTSLPELITSVIAVKNNQSEIVTGNIIGANIANLLFISGATVILNRKSFEIKSPYIFIDLHYLVGAYIVYTMIAYDGVIYWFEAMIGAVAFVFYSIYLIRSGNLDFASDKKQHKEQFPIMALLMIIGASVAIYFSAEATLDALVSIASNWGIDSSVIALTLLSLGTTLPELAVNISAIRQGKAEMAIGNVLGTSVFNTFMIPAAASLFGSITVPHSLLSFSLPVMLGTGILFYMVAQDKRISVWEGWLFIFIYVLFIMQVAMSV
jgi:cation:H+ antiporter